MGFMGKASLMRFIKIRKRGMSIFKKFNVTTLLHSEGFNIICMLFIYDRLTG